MSAIATYGPALSLVGLAFTKCDPIMAVVWLTLALTLDGAMCSGYNVNAFDLAPNYAGTLRAFSSMIANATGFLAPTVISFIINEQVKNIGKNDVPLLKLFKIFVLFLQNNIEAWKWVYVSATLIYIFTGTFFVIFGSTKTQPWNDSANK